MLTVEETYHPNRESMPDAQVGAWWVTTDPRIVRLAASEASLFAVWQVGSDCREGSAGLRRVGSFGDR